MRKLHKQDYTYRNVEMTLDDITLEVAQDVATKLSVNNPIIVMARDNGRMIITFLTAGYYEHFESSVQQENKHGDTWYQFGNEKIISFSTEYENYNIHFAEFWTEDKYDEVEAEEAEAMARAYFGIGEDIGRYSVYDVYSPSELGINISY